MPLLFFLTNNIKFATQEICREWEYKYEKTVDEMRYKFEQEKRDMGDERDKSERLHKEKFESEIKQRESQF